MTNDSAPGSAAPIFAALGDATRLGLMARLSAGQSASIAALTQGTGLTRQAVTKHLGVLQGAGLVHCARKGRESLWQAQSRQLDLAQSYLAQLSQRWDDRIERLRTFVED